MENEHEKNRQGEQEPKERDGSEAGRELPAPQERKSGSGNAMTGQQLWNAAAYVMQLGFGRFQYKNGYMPLHFSAEMGLRAVTKQLLAARCNVGIQDDNDRTALQVAERQGYAGIATLIRNKKHKNADSGKKDTLVQASPAQTKKQQEDADRAMKELLQEEDKDAAAATAVSQKKKQANRAGNERMAPRRCRRTRREPKGGTRRGAERCGEDRGKGCF
jgi:hypothetical protein